MKRCYFLFLPFIVFVSVSTSMDGTLPKHSKWETVAAMCASDKQGSTADIKSIVAWHDSNKYKWRELVQSQQRVVRTHCGICVKKKSYRSCLSLSSVVSFLCHVYKALYDLLLENYNKEPHIFLRYLYQRVCLQSSNQQAQSPTAVAEGSG